MRLAILSTDTLHHAYFVQEIAKEYDVCGILLETSFWKAAFDTAHPFEVERETYEQDAWFGGERKQVSDFAACFENENANTPESIEFLAKLNPDIIVVFGTGKIRTPIINKFQNRILNLHGGDPEEYRGLDSHLWAIYHNDFLNLVTCIHQLTPDFDAGDIIETISIPLVKNMQIHQIRKANTEVTVELTRNALIQFQNSGRIAGHPQKKKGRYYSFMPTDLKEVCEKKFDKYSSTL